MTKLRQTIYKSTELAGDGLRSEMYDEHSCTTAGDLVEILHDPEVL